jgi:hypothetical protein
MAPLVVLLGLVLLCVLAARFGADSRDLPRSHEHELARLGLVWGETPERAARVARDELSRRRRRTAVHDAVAAQSLRRAG